MDPISTALTVAWLDAVRRVQTKPPPDAVPDSRASDASITDAIERALRDGGPDSREPGYRPVTEGAVIDRWA